MGEPFALLTCRNPFEARLTKKTMALAPKFLRAVAPHPVGRLKRGFQLLRNPNVSIFSKLLAFALGIILTLILIALEIPLEGVLAFLVPFAGAIGDITFDGIELILLPIFFTCLFLPGLARTLPSPA